MKDFIKFIIFSTEIQIILTTQLKPMSILKMFKPSTLLIIFFALLSFVSCKKNSNSPNPVQAKKLDTDVYITGYVYGVNGSQPTIACYWKNGVLHKIAPDTTLSSEACGIFIKDTDVYISANTNIFSEGIYLKNGVIAGNFANSYVNGITVSGNDVYVTGSYTNGILGQQAVYWKNGSMVSLTSPQQFAAGQNIAINGNDIYVAGVTNNLSGPFVYATVWKNGTATTLGQISPAEYVNISLLNYKDGFVDMALNGSDTYVSGMEEYRYGEHYYPSYWKNGMFTPLGDTTTSSGVTTGVAVHNGIPYFVGYNPNIDASTVSYWANNIQTMLTTGADINKDYTPTGITFAGNDMYVCAYSNLGRLSSIIYWKNKTKVVVYNGYAVATGIGVVVH